MNPDGLRFRMTALGVVVACLFGALFVRLWYLQVLNSAQYQVAAQHNGVRILYTPAPRGRILDRNGKVIVDNSLIDVLTVNRALIEKNPTEISTLAAVLGEATEALKLAITDPRYNDLAPIPVFQPNADQITYVKEHSDELPDVSVAQQIVRTYPYGSLAAHLLGYVGETNGSELAAHKGQGYRPGDNIGKAGVELAYESQLRGVPGVEKLEVDSNGNVLGTLDTQAPVQGHDLRLTIDINVQRLAEESLNDGLVTARATVDRVKNSAYAGQNYPAPAGAVVVLDPRNGQVLALASNPTYDPTSFVNGISSAEYSYLTATANNEPLEDRATSGLYAPGSTFKMVTATAGLQHGLITPGTPFQDKGFIKVGQQKFFNDGHNIYGTVDLPTALTVSSDAYFYTLGADFWENGRSLALQDTARQYGFGAPTGIPIGGEQAGRVPDPTSRRKEYDQFPGVYATPNWFTGDNVNLAVGQGELVVTPLQLANAYAAFANGGTLYQPQVAVDIEHLGTPISIIGPRVIRQVPLDLTDREAMLSGFKGVVSSANGTAHGAFTGYSGASIAGKTGTAQVLNKEPTSVFVAWAPADNPQYVVAVVEEQAGYGASAAAPVARRILEGLYGQATPPPAYISNAALN
ncbi:MAG: penicillin-binding protein 2 [Acidimicrobiales bacterium]